MTPARRLALGAAVVLAAAAGYVGFAVLPDLADHPPRLAQGLPANPLEADPAFDARIKAAFPPGSAEADLIRQLSDDGFTLSTAETNGWARDVSFPCERSWQVDWDAKDGLLTASRGQYTDSCL
jgi:hypothetical protein